MTRELVLSLPAEDDVLTAREWYNQKRHGLGEDFILCVEYALGRIIEYPESFPTAEHGMRRTLLRRFPYGVFYRLRDDRIEVEAIFSLRADPSELSRRVLAVPLRES